MINSSSHNDSLQQGIIMNNKKVHVLETTNSVRKEGKRMRRVSKVSYYLL